MSSSSLCSESIPIDLDLDLSAILESEELLPSSENSDPSDASHDQNSSDSVSMWSISPSLTESEMSYASSSHPSVSSTCSSDGTGSKFESNSVPLYNGAEISVFDSYFLLFQFAVRHSLTSTAFTELLHLIKVHIPPSASNMAAKSIYRLKKYFLKLFPHAKSVPYRYCTTCLALVNEQSKCDTSSCSGTKCEEFLSIPLGPQLKEKCERQNLLKDLMTATSRRTKATATITDVRDGLSYKTHSAFLSQPNNISLMMNTDGVAMFRSSTVSLWPIWLVINELPPERRFRKKNMLLGGIWFSQIKPPMNIFLRPLVDEINELESIGVNVSTHQGNQTVRAILLMCSVDLPARANVSNMKQFNGKYSCLYCENQGETRPGNPLHRFWTHNSTCATRTSRSFRKNVFDAVESGVPVKGVVGPSVLALHRPFSFPTGVVVDDLHCIYLGVTKTLLNLWLNSKHKHSSFYFGNKVAQCDARLLEIKVPDFVSRVPKSLTDTAHWKGSEYRNWLLYYSLPVLHNIMLEQYFKHYILLVNGILLLSSESISQQDLQSAEKLIYEFYIQYSQYYGKENVTHNIHLLLHLSDCVRQWGPLWAYTCFEFESMNGHLKKLFHGTRNMSKQMAFSFVAMQALPNEASKLSSAVIEFGQLLCGLTNKRPSKHVQAGQVYLLGQVQLRKMPFCVPDAPVQLPQVVQVFQRAEVNGQVFYSQEYSRVHARNSYTVQYSTNGLTKYGLIQFFVFENANAFVVIKPLLEVDRRSDGINMPCDCRSNPVPVQEASTLIVTKAEALIEKVLYLTIEQNLIIKFSQASTWLIAD